MKSASILKLSLVALFGLLTLIGAGCQQKSEYEDKPIPTGKPNPNAPKMGLAGGGPGPGGGAPAPAPAAAPPTSVKSAATTSSN